MSSPPGTAARVDWQGSLHLLATARADLHVREQLLRLEHCFACDVSGQWDFLLLAPDSAPSDLHLPGFGLGLTRYVRLPVFTLDAGLPRQEARPAALPAAEDGGTPDAALPTAAAAVAGDDLIQTLSETPLTLLVPLHVDPIVVALGGCSGFLSVQRYLTTLASAHCHVLHTTGTPALILLAGLPSDTGLDESVKRLVAALQVTWQDVDDHLAAHGLPTLSAVVANVNSQRPDRQAEFVTAQTMTGLRVFPHCTVTPMWRHDRLDCHGTKQPVKVNMDLADVDPAEVSRTLDSYVQTGKRWGLRGGNVQQVTGHRTPRITEASFSSFAGLAGFLDEVRSGPEMMTLDTATYFVEDTEPLEQKSKGQETAAASAKAAEAPAAQWGDTEENRRVLAEMADPACQIRLMSASQVVRHSDLFALDRAWLDDLWTSLRRAESNRRPYLAEYAADAVDQRRLSLWAAVAGTQSFASSYGAGFARCLRGLEWVMRDFVARVEAEENAGAGDREGEQRAKQPGQAAPASHFVGLRLSQFPQYLRIDRFAAAPLRMLTDPLEESVRLWHEGAHIALETGTYGRLMTRAFAEASGQVPPDGFRQELPAHMRAFHATLLSELAGETESVAREVRKLVRETFAHLLEFWMYAQEPEGLERLLYSLCVSWMASSNFHDMFGYFLCRATTIYAFPHLLILHARAGRMLTLSLTERLQIASLAVDQALQTLRQIVSCPWVQEQHGDLSSVVREFDNARGRQGASHIVARCCLPAAACLIADNKLTGKLTRLQDDPEQKGKCSGRRAAELVFQGRVVEAEISNLQAFVNECHKTAYSRRGLKQPAELRAANLAYLCTLMHIAEANARAWATPEPPA